MRKDPFELLLGFTREGKSARRRHGCTPRVTIPQWSKLLDVNMLVVTGGRERTHDEFEQLFARAGLSLQRVVPTAYPLSVLEAIPA